MKAALEHKLESLLANLNAHEHVAVAFSGGVDSSFLLFVASKLARCEAVALTCAVAQVPKRALDEAAAFCTENGIEHVLVDLEDAQPQQLERNPLDRCYICKKSILGHLASAAREHGCTVLVEGSNLDDATRFRPGHRAVEECGVKSPLMDAKLTKDDIRKLSKAMGLSTWNKQSESCLYTRFEYDTPVKAEDLRRVEAAEAHLRELGFTCVRVRVHGPIARIEVGEGETERLVEEPVRRSVVDRIRKLGFAYATVDLEGFRSGSMDAERGVS